jgi:ABC-type branched-subunit amino acid transport system ATPase component/ABC-type branched-subunit amino acid transport system permease subunit
MVSLAQATFVTAGGLAAGWALNRNWGFDLPLIASHGQLNFAAAAIIGVLAASAVGALIAWPATRLGAVYLAIWSLAAAFFFTLVPFAYESIGHGSTGWTIRSPTLDLPGLSLVHRVLTTHRGPFDFSQLPDQILLFLAVFGTIAAVVHALRRSTTGRSILAVRSSEVAAEAAGIRANRTKVLAFALAAGIAGLGGVMLSLFSFSASNSTAPPIIGLLWLALAVVFGVRRPGGALLAGFAVAAGGAILQGVGSVLPGTVTKELIGSAFFLPIVSGMGAIVLAQEPDGILALVGRRTRDRGRARGRREIFDAQTAAPGGRIPDCERPQGEVSGPLREPDGVAVALRGIVAGYHDVEVLHGIDLDLRAGQIVALLGANGAGKSTLCAVTAGLLTPTRGGVFVGGQEVTSWPTYRRARQGLLLVPEARGVFPGLTVDENLAVFLPTVAERDQAYQRLPTMAARRAEIAGNLSGGEQQMLSLAPALVRPPNVLIADEPTLGLAPLIAEEMMRTVLEVRNQGSAVLLVEEHARNALEVADVIAFMELGAITWVGPRDQVDLERLSSVYLGRGSEHTMYYGPHPMSISQGS